MEEQIMHLSWWVYVLYFAIGFSIPIIWNAYDSMTIGIRPSGGFWGTLFVAICWGILWIVLIVIMVVIWLLEKIFVGTTKRV